MHSIKVPFVCGWLVITTDQGPAAGHSGPKQSPISLSLAGSLLNAALMNIINSVLSIEEFSADDCDRLHAVLTLVIDVAADFFQTETSSANPQVTLHECVSNWLRFKELVLFLDCGLQAVADRWADGKGPLALHLTATEVRRLVTAVFENTRKRDMFLSRLKM